jgi:hypothetical protein
VDSQKLNMKIIFILLLLFISFRAIGQNKYPDQDYYELVLHNLDTVGTITQHDLALKFGQVYKTTGPGVFVADDKAKKMKRLLQKQGNNKWTVYVLDSDNLVDINFDGYKDLKLFCDVCGGAHNADDDIYIFNPKTNSYEYSTLLSGSDIEIDPKQKTVTSTYNAGGGNYVRSHRKFENGKVVYLQGFSCKIVDIKKHLKRYSYQKLVDGKIIVKLSKLVVDAGDSAGFFDWLSKYEQ